MATLIWNEDFEVNSIATIFSGGNANASIDTTVFKTGAKSAKFAGDPGYGFHTWSAGAITVFKAWIRLASIPGQGIELMTLNGGPRFGYDVVANKFGWINGTAQTMDRLSNVTPVAGQWYLFEFRLNVSANPWVLDYQIDGVAQPQITYAAAATTSNGIYLGHTTGFSVFVTLNCDLVQVSQTAADYPLSVVSITVVALPAVATFSSVAQIVTFDNTETSPPAVTTFSAVAPTLRSDSSQVSTPAVTSFVSVAPVISISPAPTAPPATFTASAVAPGLGRTLAPAAAVFTGSSVAPVVRVDLTIAAPPATFTASAVAPAPRVDETNVAPPATFTAAAVAPVISVGVSNTIVVPPATTTFSSATSATGITMATTPAVWTASSVAPVVSKVVSVSPSPSLATYSAVAPVVSGTALVVAPPASATYASVAPSLSLGASVTAPPTTATFASVAPQVQVGLVVTSPPATWTASVVAPGLGQLLVTTVGIWTASSVAPVITRSGTVTAPPAIFTASSVGPSLITGASASLSTPAATFTASSVAPLIKFDCTVVVFLGGPNLITNGTFETDLSGWTTRGVGGTITRDTSLFHGGVASLRLNTDAQNHDAFYSRYPVVAGQTYQIQGWIYITTGSSAACYCDLWTGGSYITTKTVGASSVVGSWVQVSARILIPPGIDGLTTYFQVAVVGGVGVLNVDDVSNVMVPLSMAVMSLGTGVTMICSTSGLCLNGDFETNVTSWANASAGSTLVRDTTQAAVGSASAQCTVDGTSSQQGCYYICPTITPAYPAGMKHRVSFWIKANTPGDVGKQIGIFFRALLLGSINYTANASPAAGTQFALPATWTYMTFEFTPTLAHDRAEALWRTPGSGVALGFNLDGVVHNVVQLSMTPAPPTLLTTVQPTPALASYSSVSPTFILGVGTTVVSPPATAIYSGLVPAQGIVTSAPAGRFTAAATAPVTSVNILPNPIIWTASGVAPTIGLGTVVNSPAARITLSSTATISFSTGVGAPAATWLASSISPELVMRLAAPAAAVGYSSVAPECGTFAYIYAVPAQATFDGPVTSVIIEGSGMVYTYTPGAVWQAPDGDVAAPKTGRIVQSYERF